MDEILTVEEAADYLKVSKTTIRRWCIREQLPAFKIGREWRIYKKELERVIQRSSRVRNRAREPMSLRFE
ncbi:MAG: helix-turn-helix domain-containing protein [Anaerolineae bacterium]